MAPTHTAGPSGSAASPRPFACLVVEDHTLVAQLLTAALRVMPGIGSVTTASTVAAAVAAVADREFDLVILDLTLPDGHGLAVLRTCAARHPRAACIVLSSAADEFTCPTDLTRHVIALIDKTAPLDRLRREVAALVRRHQGRPSAPEPPDPVAVLRPRELDVFQRIGQGMTTREIATSLGITVHTINSHRKAIVAKLGVVGAELVRVAALHTATRADDASPPRPR